jgi:hypothetical protein
MTSKIQKRSKAYLLAFSLLSLFLPSLLVAQVADSVFVGQWQVVEFQNPNFTYLAEQDSIIYRENLLEQLSKVYKQVGYDSYESLFEAMEAEIRQEEFFQFYADGRYERLRDTLLINVGTYQYREEESMIYVIFEYVGDQNSDDPEPKPTKIKSTSYTIDYSPETHFLTISFTLRNLKTSTYILRRVES